MSGFLYHYHPVEPATWFYLSSLLMIGLFFKFSRFWSVRNLDLVLLILLAPGLLFIHYGKLSYHRELWESQRAASATMNEGTGAPIVNGDVAAADSADESILSSDVDTEQTRTGQREALSTGDRDGELLTDAAPVDEGAVDGDTETVEDMADLEPPLSSGQQAQKYGYLWLYGAGMLVLARLLADPTMVRRPLLEPNLSAGGLTFI
ncbi:MAG: hypothetical protein KDB23_15565, partial [Planctomycetales bacterium]|nr:hypothetical protein [Planctomycetales bacterium]